MELLNTISTSRIWTRHGLKITYAGAALVLLVSVGNAAWNIKHQNDIKTANYAEQKTAPLVKKIKQSYRINDIVRANLFGDPTPAPIAKVAPKTTLDLTLRGILSATDNKMARAIIMSGKRKSKLYSIGDSIQGAGVSVKEIRNNEVLLNRNGAIESLPLVRSKSSKNTSIISYSDGNSSPQLQTASVDRSRIRRSTPKPRSRNGQPRKIKKPNFSGLDRALQKMGEI